ncbi:chromosome transmission fidelity protein 18 homolog isoform X2 [Salvelinus fontinalis]|uniref:chromosome transmission fidelity protein 18 homolog isoform X1 n=1 Tax=Salvelinus fontinalis TaxID=8038 RepID=UPI0024868CAD|nr:chromosome transmission fidelity protein 18 homolog isoform X1 [Salvelinus fontinalis]XP_055771138.1 chromosome transmission fidelity protein 18 homolog isoform X2 [Salvelinus fontinalis]
MDEYDEMFGIEDEYDQQFADELEVLAEMDFDPAPSTKRSEFRKQKPQSFQEAVTAGDQPLRSQSQASSERSLGQSEAPSVACDGEDIEHLLADEPITPKAKRLRQDVAKKLFEVSQVDDITPPSSPDEFDRPPSSRPQLVPVILDISGFAAIQESPRRVTAATSCHVLKRPPAVGGYVSVTDQTGNRVYLRQTDDLRGKAVNPSAFRSSHNALGLLAVPIEILREQVAEKRHRQVVEESQRLTELLNSQVDEEFGELDGGQREEGDREEEEESSRLWVDQFAPQHYTELLSDDFTNRCLLKWLKLWDQVVFGRERKTRPPPAERPDQNTANQGQGRFNSFNKGRGRFNSTNRSQGNFHQANQKFKTKSQITEEILEAELDQYNRPKYKVVLLSGPPGLGKTTLAHIIAKHAGYNVVEINASDDRSAELFQKRIDTATLMRSVLGANEKPNCLIIDEIDGAPAAAISILLATLNRKDSHGAESEAEPLKKKKKKESVLLRPIICICNDLYVPALRPLRQQAFLLAFPQTQPSRLAQRLAEISRCQGMKADVGTLIALCEKTDNDIRSCINTLQFLHGRGKRQLDVQAVQSMRIGQKDQNKGLFNLWQEIFQLPRIKRKRVGEELEEGLREGGGAERLQHILHLASSTGEHDKLTQGLYDNFLSMRVKDPSLGGVCQALDWLGFSDGLTQAMLQGQNFSLMRYQPFLPVAFHFLFAHTHVPRINYPHSQYEALTKTSSSRNALAAMLSEVPACIRTRISELSLSLDILSLLLDIICPKLRPVNPQLFSDREKQQLVDLIHTMISYNLSYRQDRTPDGQYGYVLEPRVEQVVCFPGLPPHRQLTYQTKQTISREMDQERMRRAESLMLLRNPHTKQQEEKQPKAVTSSVTSSVRNHQQRLENILRNTVVEIRPEVDFFGRAVAPKEKPQVVSATGEVCVEVAMGTAVGNSDVWFRFNEGVSNAVRRNIYIRELL